MHGGLWERRFDRTKYRVPQRIFYDVTRVRIESICQTVQVVTNSNLSPVTGPPNFDAFSKTRNRRCIHYGAHLRRWVRCNVMQQHIHWQHMRRRDRISFEVMQCFRDRFQHHHSRNTFPFSRGGFGQVLEPNKMWCLPVRRMPFE